MVTKFARFRPKDSALLKTSVPFRLYHSQSEAFVHASCDAEKDRTHPNGRQVVESENLLSQFSTNIIDILFFFGGGGGGLWP
jgi:hypothetical protein